MTPAHRYEDSTGTSGDGPPISWSFRRRAALGTGIGVALAAALVGCELLLGDVPGARAFDRLNGAGVALWPRVAWLAAAAPAGGLVAGALVPLYRYRFGGAVVGLLVLTLALAAGAAVGMVPALRPEPRLDFEMVRSALVLAALAVVAASIGLAARPIMLGANAADGASADRVT